MNNLLKPKIYSGFLVFILLFGIVKGNTFLSPLLLSTTVSLVDYGIAEFALSSGMILSGLFHLGVGASYAFYNIKQYSIGFNPTIVLHGIGISILGLVVGIFAWLFPLYLEIKYTLSVQIAIVFASQLILSSMFKTDDKPSIAILLDGGMYVPVLVTSLMALLSENFGIYILPLLFLIYQFILLLLFLSKWYQTDITNNKLRFKAVYTYGSSIFISSIGVFILSVGGRQLINFFFDTESVGIYSFYFRLASMVVLVHQALNIFLFKQIYSAALTQIDKYFSVFSLLIAFLSIMLWALIPLVLQEYISLLRDTGSSYAKLYLLLSLQMSFWVTMSLNENIIYRENLGNKFSLFLFSVLAFSLCILSLWKKLLNLNMFDLVFVNIMLYFFAIEGQLYLIKRKTGFNLKKTRMSLSVLVFISILVILFY